MRRPFSFVAVSALVAGSALIAGSATAAQPATKFWNLTANTITELNLAPAGSGKWGPNQTANDKDGTVEHDERLKVTGISDGKYDVRFTDDKGRKCVVKNVEVKTGDIFSVDENELKDCKGQ